MAVGGTQYASCRTLAGVSANLLRRYTFLLKLPRNSGFFFLKEEKEEGYEGISHADFTDYADFDLLGLGFRRSFSLNFSISHRFHRYTQIIDLFGLGAETQLR